MASDYRSILCKQHRSNIRSISSWTKNSGVNDKLIRDEYASDEYGLSVNLAGVSTVHIITTYFVFI